MEILGQNRNFKKLVLHPCSAIRDRRKGRKKGPEHHIFAILRPRAQNRAHNRERNFDESLL